MPKPQFIQKLSAGSFFLSVLIGILPSQGRAQTGRVDQTGTVIPVEALQEMGHQSAVRILAYAHIQIKDISRRTSGARPQYYIRQNIGSGVRFGVSNRVLTALGVVADADSLEVQVGSRTMPATLLGIDRFTQLALLSVNELLSSNEPPQPSPYAAVRGDIVMLVDPLRERTRMYMGQVVLVSPTGLIVTDLPVFAGLSGAPLLDIRGEVVGIVTLSYSSGPTPVGAGDAAAIPVDLAIHVASELDEYGQVRWGYFGATADSSQNDRIVLARIDRGSPAALAGLHRGDVITHYGGQELLDPTHLKELVLATAPGTAVPVRARRDSLDLEVNLVVGDLSSDVARQGALTVQSDRAAEALAIARWRALIDEFNRLLSLPGFDPARPDIRTRLTELEQNLFELKKVTLPGKPPPF